MSDCPVCGHVTPCGNYHGFDTMIERLPREVLDQLFAAVDVTLAIEAVDRAIAAVRSHQAQAQVDGRGEDWIVFDGAAVHLTRYRNRLEMALQHRPPAPVEP